jgi:membrane-associated phospholipid phosphatase
MVPVLDFGVRFIAMLQGLGTWLLVPMKLISFLGTEDFFMVVLPVVYWCIDANIGMQVAVILMVSNSINGLFKTALHGPRPYWYSSSINGFAQETSFGVPSNHVQSATVIWGVLAVWLRKGWAWFVAGLLILVTGLSRMYLGVHFPHDVLVGLLLGMGLLWLLVRFWAPLSASVTKWSLGKQVLFSFLASLVLILLPLIPLVWLTSTHWQPPAEWASFAGQSLLFSDIFTTSGTLFGLLGGFAWISFLGGFETKGTWTQLALRFLLGVAGVMVIRYGLKFIFPDGETIPAYVFRYVRYIAIGFWVTGGAPWTFIKLKLARIKVAEKIPHYGSLTDAAGK